MKKNVLLGVFLLMVLTSCVRAPVKGHGMSTIEPYPAIPTQAGIVLRADVYHEVAPGETVWRISKMYDVSKDSIVHANRILDINSLEKGQRLLIPNAAPIKPVVNLPYSRKWKYIIIHHSATGVGNALRFDKAHIKKHWSGLGYHFVIDNGTEGKEDGQIEVSPRWIHQQDGAHCKAGEMNHIGIGVCLVGNFSEDKVSEKQMGSLIHLVKELQQKYNISDFYIMGHRDVNGAATECPGLRFPWEEFRRRLKMETVQKSGVYGF